MKEKQKIDDLFKRALSDYRDELPSVNTEAQIFRKLAYSRYIQLLKTNLDIFTIAISIAVLANFLIIDTNSTNSISTANTYNIPQKEITPQAHVAQTTHDIHLKSGQNPQSSENTIAAMDPSIQNNKLISNEAIISKPDKNLVDTKQIITKILSDEKPSLNYPEKQKAEIPALLVEQDEKSKSPKETKLELPLEQRNVEVVENIQFPKTATFTESVTIETAPNQKANVVPQNILKDEKSTAVPQPDLTVEKLNNNSPIQTNEDQLKKKSFTKSYHSFALELSGNLDYTAHKLSGSGEMVSLIKTRNENESNIIAFSSGIELKYNTKNFFLQSGISYQQYGEKLNYDFTDVKTMINTVLSSKDSLIYIPDTIVNPPGHWEYDTLWFSRNDTSYLTTLRSIHQKNTFKYFEIPLLVGKSFAFNRFIMDVSTGVSLGLLLRADAQILSADNSSFVRIDDKCSPYMNDLTMNYILRIAFRYSINEKWSVFARPSLKLNLGSLLNASQYAVQQKYTLYGIGIGIMYKF